MNGLTEPPAGATPIRWFIPTWPDLDRVLQVSHAFVLPPGPVTPNHYIGADGDSYILNEDSRETNADDPLCCLTCVRELRGRS